ncbi:12148_t:CDS:2 [Racocetra fulgida]|uniref:12148_t:CDS:1 n=1 Tax=Racocetra fulgida TaxID=60492 RepID=A0A9N8WBJ0_9GLOM|nr:12148_t:CDS:2 [Racocetra fulgida]
MTSRSNYVHYKFFCKCRQEFQSFSEFLNHLKDSHQIERVNMSEILASGNVKQYHLNCKKCGKVARFDKKELLTKFLKERVKQILIYSFYRRKFTQFIGEHSEKKLKGHKQDLCEKCKSLGRYCGEK